MTARDLALLLSVLAVVAGLGIAINQHLGIGLTLAILGALALAVVKLRKPRQPTK
jgi:hypothetical protein